jgi:hypothetical protein
MTLPTLIAALAFGTALLAVWCFVRWPSLAPSTIKGALIHGILAFGAIQLAATGLGFAADASAQAAAFGLIAFVVPALTYAFLAALWTMRLFAGALKGA